MKTTRHNRAKIFSLMGVVFFLVTAGISLAQSREESGAFRRATPDHVLSGEKGLRIQFGSAFISPQEIPPGDPLLDLLRGVAEGPLSGSVFCSRASYTLPIESQQLHAELFQDFQITQFLLGERYSLTKISQNPFRFRGRRTISFGLFYREIESETNLSVSEWGALGPERQQLLLRLFGASAPPQRIAFQAITNFNQYGTKGFLLTAIYPGATQGSARIELYGATVLNDSEASLIPDFVRNGVIRSVAENDLVGYNTRLMHIFARTGR